MGRRRKMEEEDQQYSNMKPAQALFARRIASKNNHDHSNKENRNNETISSNNRRIKDMKAKFFQQVDNKEAKESHNFHEILWPLYFQPVGKILLSCLLFFCCCY